jgi:hypothetical protein
MVIQSIEWEHKSTISAVNVCKSKVWPQWKGSFEFFVEKLKLELPKLCHIKGACMTGQNFNVLQHGIIRPHQAYVLDAVKIVVRIICINSATSRAYAWCGGNHAHSSEHKYPLHQGYVLGATKIMLIIICMNSAASRAYAWCSRIYAQNYEHELCRIKGICLTW